MLETPLFAPISQLPRAENLTDKHVRTFIGDGTPFLRLPGLKDRIDEVLLDGYRLPEEETREYPTDATLKRLHAVTHPTMRLERDENGVPVLQRAEFSNGGLWQLGSKITVRGSWEDAEEVAPAASEASKK